MKHSVRNILKDFIPTYDDKLVIKSIEDGDYSFVLYGHKLPEFEIVLILCRNNITKPMSYNRVHAFDCRSYSELSEVVRDDIDCHTTKALKDKIKRYIQSFK